MNVGCRSRLTSLHISTSMNRHFLFLDTYAFLFAHLPTTFARKYICHRRENCCPKKTNSAPTRTTQRSDKIKFIQLYLYMCIYQTYQMPEANHNSGGVDMQTKATRPFLITLLWTHFDADP